MWPDAARRRLCAAAALSTTFSPARAAADLCRDGHRQSPIDITQTRPAAGPALRLDYHPAPLQAAHDGHTVRVRFPPGASRLWLGTQAHGLQQFHFHRPGGDRINGEEFPLGMHFLHKSTAGQLVSLVVLLRLGAEHPALAALLPQLPGPGQPARSLPGVMVDPAAWVPASRSHFRYEGSLTASPCTEGVLWLVMQQPLQLSAAQMAALSRLFEPNARAVQPLHGRVVSAVP